MARDLRTSTLRDGTEVRLREQAHGDRDVLAQFFERLSPGSRYMRFMAGMPARLPASLLNVLDAADGQRHVGVIAVHRGQVVGTARYIQAEAGSPEADVGLTVADELQGQGLGRLMMEELVSRAAASGIERLSFEMLSENRAMRALARAFGASLRTDGPTTFAVLRTPAHNRGSLVRDQSGPCPASSSS